MGVSPQVEKPQAENPQADNRIQVLSTLSINDLSNKEHARDFFDKANKTVDAILENERKMTNSWVGREKIPESIRALLDVYVELTGQTPSKGKLMDWLQTGNEWLELGITPIDLRKAYEKANPPDGRGFAVVRPGSLTATAGAIAGERRKHATPIRDPMETLNRYRERLNG